MKEMEKREGTRRYWYSYTTVSTYSREIHDHAFLLKCSPMDDGAQRIETARMEVVDAGNLSARAVGSGATAHFGVIASPHRRFIAISQGIVDCGEYCFQGTTDTRRYLSSTALTVPSASIAGIAAGIAVPVDTSGQCEALVMSLMHSVYTHMAYLPGVTCVATTAAEAWEGREGVCQDYAHILLSLCRCCGIPARYVSGLMEGEGATHAWVEAWTGKCWHGFDPTHDRKVTYGYLKLSHGRDARDCDVVRGMYRGCADEHTEVSVNVMEL